MFLPKELPPGKGEGRCSGRNDEVMLTRRKTKKWQIAMVRKAQSNAYKGHSGLENRRGGGCSEQKDAQDKGPTAMAGWEVPRLWGLGTNGRQEN